jgi:hypothetical protein
MRMIDTNIQRLDHLSTQDLVLLTFLLQLQQS